MAAGLGTAVADPTVPLPLGAAVALCGGVALFYATTGAVSLRYGLPLARVAGLGCAGRARARRADRGIRVRHFAPLVALLAAFLAVLIGTERLRRVPSEAG